MTEDLAVLIERVRRDKAAVVRAREKHAKAHAELEEARKVFYSSQALVLRAVYGDEPELWP